MIFLKPKNDAIEAFVKGVKEHNSIFHNKTEGISAYLRNIVSGKKAGHYIWIEGPMSFVHVVNKPRKKWQFLDQSITESEYIDIEI